MSRYNHHQSAFKNGMISPKLLGRTDIDEYAYSARDMLNFLPAPMGGAFSRPGTVAELFFSDECCTIPWERSQGLYYIVYHPSTGFTAFDATFTPKTCSASLDQLNNYGTTAGLPTHEDVINFQTNAGANLLNLDIHGFTRVIHENVLIIAHNSGLMPPLAFKVNPTGGGVRYEHFQFTGQLSTSSSTGSFFGSTDVALPYKSTPYFINRDSTHLLSSVAIPGGQAGLQTTSHVTTTLTSYDGNTATPKAFFTADMKWTYLVINQSNVEAVYFITAITDDHTATAVVVYYGADAVTKSNRFRYQLFRPSLGFPKVLSIFNNRIILANTITKPNWFWASRTNDLKEILGFVLFQLIATNPITEASSFELPLTSKSFSEIKWISQQNDLLMGTNREEFVLKQGEDALSIVNIGISAQSNIGSSNVPAVKNSESAFFVTADGKGIRQIQYNFNQNGYRSKDLSILNDDLIFSLREGQTVNSLADIVIKKIVWQESNRALWVLTSHNNLYSITLEPNSETVAWAPHRISNSDSVIDIFAFFSPSLQSEALGMIVKRGTNYFMNFMAPKYLNDEISTSSMNIADLPIFMDSSAVMATLGTASTFITRQLNPAFVSPAVAGFNQRYPTGKKFVITASSDANATGTPDARVNVGQFVYLINKYTGYGNPVIGWATSLVNALAGTEMSEVGGRLSVLTVDDAEPTAKYTKWGTFAKYANETVDVVADGVLYEALVVSAGGILTMPVAVSSVIFGFRFEGSLETATPDSAGSFGSSQGSMSRVDRAFVRYYRSYAGKIGSNNDNLSPIEFPANLPYSGTLQHVGLGSPDAEFRVVIKKTKSLPLNVMSVTLRGQVNE